MNHIKRLILLSCLITLVSLPVVSKAGVLSFVQTGIRWIDVALNAVTGGNPAPLAIYSISRSFDLSPIIVESLVKQGLSFTDIYYLGFLHQQTGQPVEEILKNKNRGIGWGVVAQRLGIHPGEFNKARIALKKQNKAQKQKTAPGLEKKEKNKSAKGGKDKQKNVAKSKPGKAKGKKK